MPLAALHMLPREHDHSVPEPYVDTKHERWWCGAHTNVAHAWPCCRRGSADAYALDELRGKSVYGKSLATGQTLNLVGGHRGVFARLAFMACAKQVYSYEPHPGNAMVYSWDCRGCPANCTAADVRGGWGGEEHRLAGESQS